MHISWMEIMRCASIPRASSTRARTQEELVGAEAGIT